jgi:O-antigen/teichoic acid export membrane protein
MLAQKLILSYSSKILFQFIQLCASIVVARIAGPTVLGTLAFGLAYVSTFQFIADLGIGTAHIKLISEGRDLGKCISTYSVMKTITNSFFFLVVLGFFFTQKHLLKITFESQTHEFVIFIMLISLTIDQFLSIPKTTFVAKTEQAKQDIPEFIRTIAHQILRVVFVMMGFKAIALAFSQLISIIIMIPIILYLYRSYPTSQFDWKLAKEYSKIAFPVILIGLSTKVISTIDKVVLQFFSNSEQVGYYTAGFRISGFVLLIASSVGMLFFPLFSQAVSKRDFNYIKEKIEKFEGFSYLFIMPVTILLAICSELIVKVVLGNQYLPSINIMATITIAMFILLLNMPYGNLITGMGFFRLAAIINLFNLILFISILIIMVNPKFLNLGGKGTAYTILISNLFIFIVFRIIAKKKMPALNIYKGVKFIVYGILNFSGSYYLYNTYLITEKFLFKILFVIGYLLVTYATFYLLRWINKEDWKMFLKIFDTKSMKKYIKQEITRK